MSTTKTAAATIVRFPEAFEPFTKLAGQPFLFVPLRALPNGQYAIGAKAPTTPVATPATPAATPVHTADETATPAAHVVYVARKPLTAKAVAELPPHDRKVYGLIARHTTNGATRAQLLTALDAHAHTGSVDGAVRRLRVKGLIVVKTIRTPLGAAGAKSSVPLKAGRREAAGGARGGAARAADGRRRR